MDEDLFDFSGGQAAVIASTSALPTHKRKAEQPSSVHRDVDAMDVADTDEDEEDAAGPSGNDVAKRPRTGSPRPMVVDEFETTESIELPASGGLTANADALKPLTWAKKVQLA